MIINKYHISSPTQIIDLQLGISQNYRQECIKEIYRLGDSQNQSTNIQGIMTTYRIWEESKVFNLLLEQILNLSAQIDKSDPKYKLDHRYKYKLNDTWGAIYKKNHYSLSHHHMPSYLSFVYYLKSNGTTPLVFDKCNFSTNPIDDMLIIFPGYLWHSVPIHKEDEDRICIAGNIDLIEDEV